MKHKAALQRPGSPAKELQASVVKKLEPNSSMILEKESTENSTQITIKGDIVLLKSRQTRIAAKLNVLNPDGPGAQRAWKEWFEIDNELQELEEVA